MDILPEDPEVGKEYKPIRTTRYLSKYEKARILGTRAMQIAEGAPVKTEKGNETDPLILAEEELAAGETPLLIRRHLPDGEYEDVAVRFLERFDKRT
jgi:DNA-directed RNA polymerase I, II, and III subunit RPABC2